MHADAVDTETHPLIRIQEMSKGNAWLCLGTTGSKVE